MSITTIEKPTFQIDKPIESVKKRREFKVAQHALAELIDTATNETSFSVLETLRREVVNNPELRPVLDELIDSTADILLGEITQQEVQEHKYIASLRDTWVAIRAWDTVRDASTTKLAVHVLNHCRGEGQPSLVAAFIDARESGKPFDTALDEHNQQQIAA